MNNTQIISPGFPDTVGSPNGAAACSGSGVARSARLWWPDSEPNDNINNNEYNTKTYTYNLTKTNPDVSIE